MTAKERIQQHYEKYLEQITEVLKKRKPLDGFLGLGNPPAKHPCNDEFFYGVQFELTDIKKEGAPHEELKEMMEYMYLSSSQCELGSMVTLMLMAPDGLTEEFVGDITPEEAAELYELYLKLYPKKRDRLPNQEKLFKSLKKRAGK